MDPQHYEYIKKDVFSKFADSVQDMTAELDVLKDMNQGMERRVCIEWASAILLLFGKIQTLLCIIIKNTFLFHGREQRVRNKYKPDALEHPRRRFTD